MNSFNFHIFQTDIFDHDISVKICLVHKRGNPRVSLLYIQYTYPAWFNLRGWNKVGSFDN